MNLSRRGLTNMAVVVTVFAGTFVFYSVTGPADVAWFEGAETQRRVALAEVGDGPWERPLYVLLAQPFLFTPAGSVAQKVNLASAAFAAGACVFLYLLLKHLLLVAPQFIARRVGILAALTLAVSHTFWSRAVTPGPEIVDALLLTAMLYFLLRFVGDGRVPYLYLGMLLLGLSLANNLMFLFLSPVVLLFVRFVRPPLIRDDQIGRVRAKGLFLFLVGVSLALAVAASGWAAAGWEIPPEQRSWLTFWRGHMRLSWEQGLGESLARFGILGLYNFPPWTMIVGLIGLLELFRRQKYVFGLVFPLLLISGALAVTLTLSDPIPAYLPAWVLFSIPVGYGWWKLLAEGQWTGYVVALLLSASPLFVYRWTPTIVTRLGEEVRARSLLGLTEIAPIDTLAFWLNPDRRDADDARSYGRGVLESLPDGARVVPASANGVLLLAPVRYMKDVESAKPGVRVERSVPPQDADLSPAPGEALFVVGLHPPHPALGRLLDRFHFMAVGHLFEVVPRDAVPGRGLVDSDAPTPLAGEWYGHARPQGYPLRFSIVEGADGTYTGIAVLNEGAARPLQGEFTRISHIADAVVSRVAYDQDRVHVQIDSSLVGNRIEGTWVVYEAPQLTGTFVVWKQQAPAVGGQ